MSPRVHRFVAVLIVAAANLVAVGAQAHSASNAYLTIVAIPHDPVLKAQLDVALRDLEFIMGLDANGDGQLTWGEVRARSVEIQRYVYSRIDISAGGKSCKLDPEPLQIDDHSDGAYAVMSFEVRCAERAPPMIVLDYRLFFDIDPSHRGIFVLRKGDEVSSALLSPERRHIELRL